MGYGERAILYGRNQIVEDKSLESKKGFMNITIRGLLNTIRIYNKTNWLLYKGSRSFKGADLSLYR